MKIIQDDQTAIVAKDRPISSIFVGSAFMAFGAAVMYAVIRVPAKPEQGVQLWYPLIFIGLGALAVILATFITVRLDKGTGQGTILRKRIVGRREETFALSAVKEMRHEKTVRHSRRGSRQISRIAFILNDGRHIEVKFPGRGFSGSEVGARMANFLGVPFTDTRPPTMREAFASMRGALKDVIEKKKQSGGKGGGDIPPPIIK